MMRFLTATPKNWRSKSVSLLFCTLVAGLLSFWPALSAKAQGLNEYTLALPQDLPEEYTLCQVSVVIQDTGIYAATMLYEGSEPLTDGGAMQSSRSDFVYRTWVTQRGGSRTLVVQTTATNIFNVEAGFCAARGDVANPVGPFYAVNAPLVGGSFREENPRGVYDGIAEIAIDVCGFDDGFETGEQIEAIIGNALLGSSQASYAYDSFQSDDDGRAHYRFRLVDHPASLRGFVEGIKPGFSDLAEFSYFVGNRVLYMSACDRKGLWVTVEANGKIVWTEQFDGFRLLALRKEAGNIFVTYAAGVDSIYLNVAAVRQTGGYPIVLAPQEDDARDPETITYGMAHFGGTAGRPHVVKSTTGMLRLTALDARTGISGFFRFSALDENGAPRTVRGGFQEIPLR